MYMQGDWKREQDLCKQLQKDVAHKEDQVGQSQITMQDQAAMISHLNQQVKNKEITIQNMELKLYSKQNTPKVDIKDLELANKNAKTIDELEILLSQRTDALNQAQNDLNVFEQHCAAMEEQKIFQNE